jgi:protein-S-isoprenylcysteine O-methyltransferase Ste14
MELLVVLLGLLSVQCFSFCYCTSTLRLDIELLLGVIQLGTLLGFRYFNWLLCFQPTLEILLE